MSNPEVAPPRPGYNRDGWDPSPKPAPAPVHDPLVINWPLVFAGLVALGGFLTPASIIIWKVAI